MIEKRSRASRFAVLAPPDYFTGMSVRRGPWHETEEEIKAGLAWGRRKRELLRWVRREMGRRLTARERHCVELHFFCGLSCLEVAKATGTTISSAHRAIKRSLRKLRYAAGRRRLKESVTRRGVSQRAWMARRGNGGIQGGGRNPGTRTSKRAGCPK
jgi:DNA-directed RNA polymerase specialized sigma24 family protein